MGNELPVMIYKENKISSNILFITNFLYTLYIIDKYIQYINRSNNLCIQTNNEGHLDWTWKKDFNYIYYLIIMFINTINFIYNKNILFNYIITHILLVISYFNFNKNIGEFWCLTVTGVPLFNLIFQKLNLF